jgi:hypothetical protein
MMVVNLWIFNLTYRFVFLVKGESNLALSLFGPIGIHSFIMSRVSLLCHEEATYSGWRVSRTKRHAIILNVSIEVSFRLVLLILFFETIIQLGFFLHYVLRMLLNDRTMTLGLNQIPCFFLVERSHTCGIKPKLSYGCRLKLLNFSKI